MENYTLPNVRRLDFGTGAVQVGAPIQYIAFNSAAYVSKAVNALGWSGAAVFGFDRGSGSTPLLQDGVFAQGSSGTSDFQLDMPAANTAYRITVVLGDMQLGHDAMSVTDVTGGGSVPVLTNLSTPAGQATSHTFTATSDGNGAIKLRFCAASSSYWSLLALEARPVVGSVAEGCRSA